MPDTDGAVSSMLTWSTTFSSSSVSNGSAVKPYQGTGGVGGWESVVSKRSWPVCSPITLPS